MRLSRGGTLLEALVALALVSLGTLSAAMLQLSSRRAQAEGQQRALAAEVAQDYASRLRSSSQPAGLLGTTPLPGDLELLWPMVCIRQGGSASQYQLVVAWRGLVTQPEPDDACGRDPQPDGASHYSRRGADNAYRRTLVLPLWIARALP